MNKSLKVVSAAALALGLVLAGVTPAHAGRGETTVPTPIQIDNCGTNHDQFVFQNTNAISWSWIRTSSGKAKVFATLKEGYWVPEGTQTVFVFPGFSTKPC
jgi:hypothetical protein